MFKNRRRVIINSVVFLLALTIYLGVHNHYSTYLNIGNVAKELEQSINDEIKDVRDFVEQTECDDYDRMMTYASQKPYRDFFVVKGDSVVYYTSNELIISDPCAFQEQENGFCLAKTPNRLILFNQIKQQSDSSLIHVI
ncbi:MAG TPA: hypothetical protein VJ939_09455, partial [Bacteroidales bacterium]|nr:hypothetical protein [Bacteroidales bacterium]